MICGLLVCQRRFAICFILIDVAWRSHGVLTDPPRNTAAAVGQSVTIACKTQNGPVTWRYKNVQTTGQPKTIYLNGTFQEAYASTNITVGTYDLNFAAVQLSDAGSYTCQDNALDGKSAWLTVFDNDYPNCTSSESKSNDTHYVTELTCSVNFNATLDPSQRSFLVPVGNWSVCSPTPVVTESIQQLGTLTPNYRRLTSKALIVRSQVNATNITCHFNVGVVVSSAVTIDSTVSDNRAPVYVGQTWTYIPPRK